MKKSVKKRKNFVGPPKKKFTKYRLVNSIDTSLNEENFEQLVYVNKYGNFEIFTGYMKQVRTQTQRKYTGLATLQMMLDANVLVIP